MRQILSCKKFIFWFAVVTIMYCLAVPLYSQSGERIEDDFAGELNHPDGAPRFLNSESLVDILSQDYESLQVSEVSRGPRQIAHELVTHLIQRYRTAAEFDEDGCIRPLFDSHRELLYLQPPEAFDDPSQGGRQTPVDLASQAPEILVIEVEAAQSGAFGSELGTLVRFRVEEWIKRDPEREALGEPAYFFSSGVWLNLESSTFCQKREGVENPRAGDRYILFGKRNELLPKHFWTGNEFPLDGVVVLPQRYPLMDVYFPVSLHDVRRSIS